ncbi:MAG: hypothetical protein SF029_19710 [bacterium]|nr:hypothetical protein [bacterium]
MSSDNPSGADFLAGYLLKQNALQQKLLETQQETIRLYQKLEQVTPSSPGENIHWHKVSGGITSEEVLASDDLQLVLAFRDWMLEFGNTYIKPYVHLKVYGEIMSHMMRGVSKRLAELEVKADFETMAIEAKTLNFIAALDKAQGDPKNSSSENKQEDPQQPRLIE